MTGLLLALYTIADETPNINLVYRKEMPRGKSDHPRKFRFRRLYNEGSPVVEYVLVSGILNHFSHLKKAFTSNFRSTGFGT
jgi:hypothetical protein